VCDVRSSGDEAMMMAKALPKASVIVCDDRMEGIELAKREGAEVVLLDDAFHVPIEKFDLLIDKRSPNPFCLPSGPYRLPRVFLKRADMVVQEGRDFWRKSVVENPTERMVLLTAIADPTRLDPFLPRGVAAKYHFADHHYFDAKELESIWQKEKPTSFLVTPKDAVKLEKFSYPLSILDLRMEIDQKIVENIEKYIQKEWDAKETPNRPDAS